MDTILCLTVGLVFISDIHCLLMMVWVVIEKTTKIKIKCKSNLIMADDDLFNENLRYYYY